MEMRYIPLSAKGKHSSAPLEHGQVRHAIGLALNFSPVALIPGQQNVLALQSPVRRVCEQLPPNSQ